MRLSFFKAEKNASARGQPLQKRYSAFTRTTTALRAPTCPTFDSGELTPCPRNSRSLFSLTLPLLLPSALPALRPNDFHANQQNDHPANHRQSTPRPYRRGRSINDASGSEIDLDLSLTLKILRIELNLMMLLFALYLYQKRIT